MINHVTIATNSLTVKWLFYFRFVNITNGVTVIESAKDISVNATRSPLNAMWTVTSENGMTFHLVFVLSII
jgi:hypothetical protein